MSYADYTRHRPDPPEPPEPPQPPMAVVEKGSVVAYCPNCGAYLFTLGFVGELDCDFCGKAFVVEEAKP
jgi:uncharacterized protein (DUF983 family)